MPVSVQQTQAGTLVANVYRNHARPAGVDEDLGIDRRYEDLHLVVPQPREMADPDEIKNDAGAMLPSWGAPA